MLLGMLQLRGPSLEISCPSVSGVASCKCDAAYFHDIGEMSALSAKVARNRCRLAAVGA